MRTIKVGVNARMERITREPPHEWEVDLDLPGLEVPRKVGRIYEHREDGRRAFEARLEVGGESIELEPQGGGEPVVKGLGFRYRWGALERIVRSAVRRLAAEAIP